jgi:hypothetical protein
MLTDNNEVLFSKPFELRTDPFRRSFHFLYDIPFSHVRRCTQELHDFPAYLPIASLKLRLFGVMFALCIYTHTLPLEIGAIIHERPVPLARSTLGTNCID